MRELDLEINFISPCIINSLCCEIATLSLHKKGAQRTGTTITNTNYFVPSISLVMSQGFLALIPTV